MSNNEKYDQAFKKLFGENTNLEDLKFKASPKWDSMAQIALISTIEDLFDINFDMEDIFELKSYQDGKEILSKKYNINF